MEYIPGHDKAVKRRIYKDGETQRPPGIRPIMWADTHFYPPDKKEKATKEWMDLKEKMKAANEIDESSKVHAAPAAGAPMTHSGKGAYRPCNTETTIVEFLGNDLAEEQQKQGCLLYTSPSPRDS